MKEIGTVGRAMERAIARNVEAMCRGRITFAQFSEAARILWDTASVLGVSAEVSAIQRKAER